MIPYIGTGHFRYRKWPVPSTSDHFQPVPVGSLRPDPGTFRSGQVPTGSVLEVVGTFPVKIVRESGSMENVGTRRIRPIPTGTDRNNPTEPGSESGCKDPAGSDRVTMTWVHGEPNTLLENVFLSSPAIRKRWNTAEKYLWP